MRSSSPHSRANAVTDADNALVGQFSSNAEANGASVSVSTRLRGIAPIKADARRLLSFGRPTERRAYTRTADGDGANRPGLPGGWLALWVDQVAYRLDSGLVLFGMLRPWTEVFHFAAAKDASFT